MTIPTETHARICAAYIGSECKHKELTSPSSYRTLIAVGGFADKEYISLRLGGPLGHLCSSYIDSSLWSLLLTSLEDITDEDLIEVAKCYGHDANLTTHSKSGAIVQGKNIITIYKNSSIRLNMEVADYLRSRSYALPHSGYSVSELIEAGIFTIKK